MKKLIWAIVIIAVIFGIYFYLFRPVAAPSESINAASTPISGVATSSAVYHISQTGSKADFSIYEVLHGSPFTSVGTTNQIAGDIAVATDASGIPSIDIGDLTIDARTFKTDSPQRDGAIGRFILKSDQAANEFIRLASTTTSIPVKNSDGSWNATTTGNLTISGVTKQETFVVNFSLSKDGALTGAASSTLSRKDFGLVIPNFSFLANVSDTFSVDATINASLATQ